MHPGGTHAGEKKPLQRPAQLPPPARADFNGDGTSRAKEKKQRLFFFCYAFVQPRDSLSDFCRSAGGCQCARNYSLISVIECRDTHRERLFDLLCDCGVLGHPGPTHSLTRSLTHSFEPVGQGSGGMHSNKSTERGRCSRGWPRRHGQTQVQYYDGWIEPELSKFKHFADCMKQWVARNPTWRFMQLVSHA